MTARVSVEIDVAGGLVVENEGCWTAVAQRLTRSAAGVTVHRGEANLGAWMALVHRQAWRSDELRTAQIPAAGKQVARRALRKLPVATPTGGSVRERG